MRARDRGVRRGPRRARLLVSRRAQRGAANARTAPSPLQRSPLGPRAQERCLRVRHQPLRADGLGEQSQLPPEILQKTGEVSGLRRLERSSVPGPKQREQQ